MASRRRQAASGSSSASAAHVPPTNTTVTPRLNPMVAAFRREVISMLNTPPPLPRHLAHLSKEKVEVLAAFERISLHGEQQQSAQLCRVGGDEGEMWVTRTEGERYYFPNAGRVNKRAREVLNDEEEEIVAEGEGSGGMDVEGEEQETPTARRARARAQRRNPRSNVEQDDPPSEGWFPQHGLDETPAQASTSRNRNTVAPNAPKKARRAPRRDLDAEDEDEGNDTERESASRRTATAKKSKKGKSKATTSSTVSNAEASGSGARRSARRAARDSPVVGRQEEEDVFTAKREQTVDDLDSLCGGFGGFELGSSIAGSVAPEFSSASFDFASPEDVKPILAGPSTSA